MVYKNDIALEVYMLATIRGDIAFYAALLYLAIKFKILEEGK